MPVNDSDLTRLSTGAAASVDAHRRESATNARWHALLVGQELDAAKRAHEALPNRAEGTSLTFERTGRHAQAKAKADRLAALAGHDENELPWADWQVEVRLRLARAEEAWVTRVDELEHADDYDIDPRAAEWDAAMAEADVMAWRELLAEVDRKVAAAQKATAGKARAKRGE